MFRVMIRTRVLQLTVEGSTNQDYIEERLIDAEYMSYGDNFVELMKESDSVAVYNIKEIIGIEKIIEKEKDDE